LTLLQDEQIAPYQFDFPPYRVTVHPPYQARIDPSFVDLASSAAFGTVADQLVSVDPPDASPAAAIDGKPIIQANVLQLDFHREEFNRAQEDNLNPSQGDPSVELMFSVLNRVLDNIRALFRGAHIKPVGPASTLWHMEYLSDAEEHLTPDPPLIRTKQGGYAKLHLVLLRQTNWAALQSLPYGYSALTWATLLLDAEAALPEVGPAIVLAATALETLISVSLDHLVRRTAIPPQLWRWINDRGDDYRKQPSTLEQWDILLPIVSARSLKVEQQQLWEVFQHLRDARNSFVHDGRAVFGKNKVEVTPTKAAELVTGAKAILDWLEPLLPQALQRPELGQYPPVQVSKRFEFQANETTATE